MIKDLFFFLCLLASGAVIWMSNMGWMTASEDVAPLLLSTPLALYLGWPWVIEKKGVFLNKRYLVIGIFFFLFGSILSFMTLMALGWIFIFFSWAKENLSERSLANFKGLSILLFMSFPIITSDFNFIGWYFRYSGALVTSTLLQMVGYEVIHSGTNIDVNGVGIFVEQACSGLNTLQSMIIAGSTLAFLTFDSPTRIWKTVPILIFAAWLANTLRIFITALCAIYISAEFVRGEFHIWLGWATILFMFVITYLLIYKERKPTPYALFSWILLILSAFASQELISAWQQSAYDREGWATFLIWLLPLFFTPRGEFSRHGAVAAIVCTTLGVLGELNAVIYVGLACAIASFFHRFKPFKWKHYVWLLTAISWMPVLGWFLQSAFAASPWVVFIVRLIISLAGALIIL